jgi:oligoendopeptidase F
VPATTSNTRAHRFVPADFNADDPQALSTLFDTLDARGVSTHQALQDFILDWEEVGAVVNEAYARAYVDMSGDTSNPDYEARYLKIIEDVLPVYEQRNFAIKQKVMASPALGELGSEYDVLLRNLRSEVGLFREENIPLATEDLKLGQEYEKIAGNEKAEFRGETYTLTQLRAMLEDPDREKREGAWRAAAGVKLADSATLDDIFDRMYEVRQQIARNAGYANYRDYKFEEYKRFDYTPEDCMAFHAAVEKHIVPFVQREYDRRMRLLGIDSLRPWDTEVDPSESKVLHPFETSDELKQRTLRIFSQVDPQLGEFFQAMIDEGLLDLDNRPGKSPGGYMLSFADSRQPFIFMNAVGSKRDVDTLLHEGGHSFHYYLARHLPLDSYHNTGAEFSEVASMSMELLARPYLGEFYGEEDLPRLLDDQLRKALGGITWIAMLDSFQHWVYTAEDHSAQARRAKWAEIEARFRPGIDWSNLEQFRDVGWQYLHVFTYPFYYIEYGIAQLGALRIWLRSLDDHRDAVEAYKRALSLGGSRPLPALFQAADLDFAMGDEVIGMVTRRTEEQIKGS